MKWNTAVIVISTILWQSQNVQSSLPHWDEYDENDSRNLRGAKSVTYPPKGYILDPIAKGRYNCSITCAPCPIGCTQIRCTDKPTYIPPKSEFFLPDNLLHRTFSNPVPAPVAVARNATGELEWFEKTFLAKLPVSIKQSDTVYSLSPTEKTLLKMSLSEWQAARAADKYTCMDIVVAAAKRALYLQKVQKMNQFLYWNTFDWLKVAYKDAMRFDRKAKKHGTAKIAPLYCYPVPIKGTIATKDLPASNGWAALYPFHAKEDAAMIKLLKAAHGVQFGLTNIPPIASGGAGWTWEAGLTLNPWGPNRLAGSGSSAGSASAISSNIATVTITEQTGGSTDGPATRSHNFSIDPPKFHYPNAGNPSLTVRNDQIGLNARSIDDIIEFDKAILGTEVAHAKAAAYVAGLSNSDIKIGCSDVHFNLTLMSPSRKRKYDAAVTVLKNAGFTFVEKCMTVNPYVAVKLPYSNSITYDELTFHIQKTLGLNLTTHEVMLNGIYGFSTSQNVLRGTFADGKGCANANVNQTVIDDYLGRVPAEMADVYNSYFDTYGVDLMLGPTDYCDDVTWTEDINGFCDGRFRSSSGCVNVCHSTGLRGSADKMFSKAKFVVPIGETDAGSYFSLYFMSRSGPKNYSVPASVWVYDEEGPKTWNLEEMYMIKRMYNVLAAAGLKRANAPLNYIDGFFD